MNDDVLTKTGHAQPDAARLAAFALLILFVALVVLLGIGLTLNPREIPSPLIDRAGRELGRKIGPAEWDSPEIVTLIQSYVEMPAPLQSRDR